MQLTVNRCIYDDKSTIGKLFVDGVFQCYTLEPACRTGEKVYGHTAIPSGRYEVIVNFSPHFGRDMPLLLNVPNFEGVRIHMGNFPTNTEGCLLLGESEQPDEVLQSKVAFEKFFLKLDNALKRGEFAFITYNNDDEHKRILAA